MRDYDGKAVSLTSLTIRGVSLKMYVSNLDEYWVPVLVKDYLRKYAGTERAIRF